MEPYTVFLFRSGAVFVILGTVDWISLEDREMPVLTETVVAASETAALGLLLLKLYDQTQQPHQSVCVRPHVDDPFNIEDRLKGPYDDRDE